MGQRDSLCIVIPMYNEADNIPELVKRLKALTNSWQVSVEVIFVDDHSTDATPALLAQVCEENPSYHYLRLAVNSGSHIAILAGMAHAKSDACVFLAADLQDPPELVMQMVEAWRAGAHVVWAVREAREGESFITKFLALLTYRLINLFGAVKLSPSGSDFALLDRAVVVALLQSVRANPSLGLEIARLGFSHAKIMYVKQARHAGKSKWSIQKKITAFIDAIITTSFVPLRLMSYIGVAASMLGFLYALVVVFIRLTTTTPIDGWATLMVVVLFFGGVQMTMLGILGEYLWRTLETARQRPLYHVQDSSFEPEA